MAAGFDKDQEIKKSAGINRLDNYSNYLELHTICSLFPALTPKMVLEGDDAFYTKNLLCNLEKINFEKRFTELKAKQKNK